MEQDKQYMRLALEMAKSTTGQTAPNPHVGSVLVRDGQIVGMGAHLKAGEPHAEVHALRMAQEKAKGATAYVTLEPCSHQGRTGPCAEALVKAGVSKVVIAALDPNPLVSGNGVKILKNAGIEVVVGVLEEEADKLNEVFNKFIVKNTPFVTLKAAMTLDGKIATSTGSSKWITGEKAREEVHRLRSVHDAILVGVNTVIADDPELTCRFIEGRNPIRVILDSTLRIPLSAKLINDDEAPTWIFTSQSFDVQKKEELEKRRCRVFVTSSQEQVDIQEVLQLLANEQITSLFVEGGSGINGAFIEKRLIDKVIFFIAPKLVGGRNALTPVSGKGILEMNDALQLQNASIKQVGEDFCIEGYLK
ncbi:bifunctional diaminohydroxyphosphoribosylaminopyrimidine deaminase/5-amino-6-(5-phosphoribosylamino)uracil reductase RibD [Bacillus taeanensis]|uniref:Riboflavin biosynthesis protein RibD n=1 Tax=Bacillus taeanensis TaxID=273032 RepID=A0A366XZL0_9BACI|nr:bifunctional diaminohydroxyphosphoribosylaminopyrimidine deaminase/5-amino-6-(5-phosphoribosylamino)uracil reductase RibD [Bacillus taeanensis]RBW71008.1 bifunctional diaminohydroxyphosphoribosylaminopyrimidine deaminase/5-amino-6-(5-phosphoribosylamino)uracil reductase RibD [Bacillus taeanensis]